MAPNSVHSFHSISDEALLKKTLVTVGAMLGATVMFVGGLTLVASIALGHAAGSSSEARSESRSEGSGGEEPHATPAMHDTAADPHDDAPASAAAHSVPRHRTTHHASESL